MAHATEWMVVPKHIRNEMNDHIVTVGDGGSEAGRTALIKFTWFDIQVQPITLMKACNGKLVPREVAERCFNWYTKRPYKQ